MSWYTKKWDGLGDVPSTWLDPQVVRVDANTITNRMHYELVERDRQQHKFVIASDETMLKKLARWSKRYVTPSEFPNVIPAAIVADQAEADERIPLLLSIPAKYRIVLIEGMRGPVDLIDIACETIDVTSMADDRRRFAPAFNRGIHGLIVSGGDTPLHPDWVRSLRDQCSDAGVAFRFEGWGEWIGGKYDRQKAKFIGQATEPGKAFGKIFWSNPGQPKVHLWDAADHYWTHASARVGRRRSGRLLDGRTHDATTSGNHPEIPESWRQGDE
jgi:protein gp37